VTKTKLDKQVRSHTTLLEFFVAHQRMYDQSNGILDWGNKVF
jgi:hypothetical protein